MEADFELCSRSRCATRLRYTPNSENTLLLKVFVALCSFRQAENREQKGKIGRQENDLSRNSPGIRVRLSPFLCQSKMHLNSMIRHSSRVRPVCSQNPHSSKAELEFLRQTALQGLQKIENMLGMVGNWRSFSILYDCCAHTSFSASCIAFPLISKKICRTYGRYKSFHNQHERV